MLQKRGGKAATRLKGKLLLFWAGELAADVLVWPRKRYIIGRPERMTAQIIQKMMGLGGDLLAGVLMVGG